MKDKKTARHRVDNHTMHAERECFLCGESEAEGHWPSPRYATHKKCVTAPLLKAFRLGLAATGIDVEKNGILGVRATRVIMEGLTWCACPRAIGPNIKTRTAQGTPYLGARIRDLPLSDLSVAFVAMGIVARIMLIDQPLALDYRGLILHPGEYDLDIPKERRDPQVARLCNMTNAILTDVNKEGKLPIPRAGMPMLADITRVVEHGATATYAEIDVMLQERACVAPPPPDMSKFLY